MTTTQTTIAAVTLTVPMQDLTPEQAFALIADREGVHLAEVDGRAVAWIHLAESEVPTFGERVDELAESLGFDTSGVTTYSIKEWQGITS